jgi:hypothetical protein
MVAIFWLSSVILASFSARAILPRAMVSAAQHQIDATVPCAEGGQRGIALSEY